MKARKLRVAKTGTACLQVTVDYLAYLQQKTGLDRDFMIHEGLVLLEETFPKKATQYLQKHSLFKNAKCVGIEEVQKVIKTV